MITLAWPWILLALPLPLLARRLPPARDEGGAALRFPIHVGLGTEAVGHRSRPSERYRRRLLIGLLAWGLLVLAAARPQWVGEPIPLPLAGRDLMLAIDVSGSMEQEDYELDGRPVSRMAVVRTVASAFVERRVGDRLGLILFGTRAYLQTPLTFDGATVAAMLRDSVVGLAGRETAIGDAIGLAVKRLREQPEGQRVLILLTDGDNNAGALDPLEAAELAAQAGVRIYTIGVGGGELGVRSLFGMRLMRQADDFDPTTLRRIAEITGGRAFVAGSRQELEAIYAELDRLEPSEREQRTYRPQRALFVWPAGLALILSVLLVVFSEGTRVRLPRSIADRTT
ncbi:VWA domain-containing protein [Allochromatium tepidum]|uniref:VWR domain protein in aerotolerance operon BatA n=1 Tax=Allochromatium tepidum TaxID=553982 RepID=A0ABN6GHV4_9GAMM|nr:VWA domain-containing protein [Allochromatium tepidum]BCU07501.1 VWR domain protein in aerotolerance operon BatA [Allochromatium tepidum]